MPHRRRRKGPKALPLLIAVLAILAGVGLGWIYSIPKARIEDQIRKAGGFDELRTECRSFYDRHQSPETHDWTGGDLKELPPGIATLQPMMVAASRGSDPPVVHIQLSAGSHRHGLIVLLNRMPMRFSAEDLPGPSRPATTTWRTRQLADEVYEYVE